MPREQLPRGRYNVPGLLDLVEARLPERDAMTFALFVYSVRSARLVDAFLSRVLAASGMDVSQLLIIYVLWLRGEPYLGSITELRDATLLSQSGMSRAVQRLETRGLLRVHPDPADGRAKRIELTTLGITSAHDAVSAVLDALDKSVEGDLDFDIGEVVDALVRLSRQLDPTGGHPGDE